MKIFDLRLTAATALLSLLSALAAPAGYAQAQTIPITDQPLFTTAGVPPLMMMVMSRDEQLFNKAYPDYTDLDPEKNNGIDTTYIDTFDYSGYFDPKLCYAYASNQFTASAKAAGTNSHQCDGTWSGNFLNWAAMSRIDLLRFVLYGGNRSTDDTTTVLERAYIPNDLHAWSKIYRGSDVGQYVPGASGPVTLCSASFGAGGAGDPVLRVASGEYPEWAATALSQCNWRETVYSQGNGSCTGAAGDNSCWDDAPKSAALGGNSGDYVVRVQVCGSDAGKRESFCQKYTDSTGAASYKPVGLLQNYGESGKLRFGLVSGSYSAPRSGGVLRRNIGKFAGNGTGTGCTTGDEVNLSNGRFCNQADSSEGIVNTIRRFKLTQWPNSSGKWSDCNDYGILNRDGTKHLNNPGTAAGGGQNCSGWGNPLSEMYAEALRYITGSTKTPGFTATGDLTGLPTPSWLDPYRSPRTGGNPYCANCSILVLASGLNSFDGDEVPAVDSLGSDAVALTKAVGDKEGTNGQDLVGRSLNHLVDPGGPAVGPQQNLTNTHVDLCTAKTVDDLAQVRGLCPDIPSMEGGYLMTGMAYQAWTTDLRPSLTNSRGDPKPTDARNTVQTYAVALAENLPKFEIPVGGSKITLAPLCQANNTGSADALGGANDTGWRSCFLGSVSIGSKKSTKDGRYVYGRALEADGSAGSFSLVWEDSLWGNDHDNDVVTMLSYCVGDQCSRSTGLPTTTTQELCWYTGTSYTSSKTCPTSASGTIGSIRVRSVKVPAGYTLKLCTNADGSTGCTSYTANTASIDINTAKSYSITGGVVPPPTAPYGGYDICWRTTTTGNDQSPVCGTDGRPTVTGNDVLVRVENLSAYAGNAMLTGYAVTGSTGDGIKRLTLRPGNTNGSILTQTLEPDSNWYKPMVLKFSAGSSSAKQLENPLFYSAKYGGFTKVDTTTSKRRPPKANEWPVSTLSADWASTDAAGNLVNVPNNYFLVRNPAKLKEQLQKVFDSVIAGASPSGSVAASASRFTVGQTLAYQSSYDSNNWIGDLKAFHLNGDGSLGGQAWSAAAKLPAGARSTIWVGVPSSGGGYTAQQFTASNLTTGMSSAMATGGGWPADTDSIGNLVGWLSGAQDNEEPNGIYRQRDAAKRLGDIVNSSPQVAYKISYGYNLLQPSTGCDQGCIDAYQTHVDAKPTTVFVGGNDGMLHAFSGAADGGSELFAYIPNAVVPKLGLLAKPKYAHTFFVDGTPAIGDAYLGGWKSVLVGSAGAGAHSVFALDVTSPSAFGSDSLLFEFNDQTDADMGQFTGIPSPPTLTADGKWITAFGNGYNGASNKAKLFVVDLSDGTQVDVDAITDAANAAPNGLSTATVIDAKGNCPSTSETVCSDGIGDTIYAGDYRGNVWKFVLTETRWVLSPTTPIFKAVDVNGHRQPITSGMFAIKNPLGGVIIYFGTGKYLSTEDNDPDHLESDSKPLVNTLYAIWDNGSGTAVTRSDLQQQKVTAYDAASGQWTMTQNAFGYRSSNYDVGKLGWYLDLTLERNSGVADPLSGERIVASPVGLLSKLFVNVFRPSGDVCLPAGVNALLELDLLNGSAAFPSNASGFGGAGDGGTGTGGQNIGSGPPLSSPNPVVTIPGQTGIPALGCPANDPTCVPNPPNWCTPDVPGYPKCADPAWCQPSMSGYPNCPAPPDCHPATAGPPPVAASPGYPYCKQETQCNLIPNAGTPIGNQNFQCRASWRQLR